MMAWSWLLMAVGVTGLLLAGRVRPALGWAIGGGAQLLWIAYALTTHQYGFLVSAVVYGVVYTRNFLIARSREMLAEAAAQRLVDWQPRS